MLCGFGFESYSRPDGYCVYNGGSDRPDRKGTKNERDDYSAYFCYILRDSPTRRDHEGGGKGGLDPPKDLARPVSSSGTSSSGWTPTHSSPFKRLPNHRPTLPLYQRPIRAPYRPKLRTHLIQHPRRVIVWFLYMRRGVRVRMKRLHPVYFFWVVGWVVEGPGHGGVGRPRIVLLCVWSGSSDGSLKIRRVSAYSSSWSREF